MLGSAFSVQERINTSPNMNIYQAKKIPTINGVWKKKLGNIVKKQKKPRKSQFLIPVCLIYEY